MRDSHTQPNALPTCGPPPLKPPLKAERSNLPGDNPSTCWLGTSLSAGTDFDSEMVQEQQQEEEKQKEQEQEQQDQV